jgi:hypothetical protein
VPDTGLFPGLLREFFYQIDLIVLLSRIAPARNACRARQVSVVLLLRPDDCMGFGKSNFKSGGFVENSGNRGQEFLSPQFFRVRNRGNYDSRTATLPFRTVEEIVPLRGWV